MYGDEIKELNSKFLKLKDHELYDVIKISYTDNRPLFITNDKPNNLFLRNKPVRL